MAEGGAEELSPVCAYVAERTGTSLSRQQVNRLRTSIDGHLRGRSEDQFLVHLKSTHGAAELAELMASIAVHKTDLFRDEVQLAAFAKHVLEPMIAKEARPLRIWSAGCATGEEVATLLILLREHRAELASSVLGTDISDAALRQARALRFHPELLGRVPAPLRERYFRKVDGAGWELAGELRSQARFERHNLMDLPYPDAGREPFDVIFCRNVLIYFTDHAFERTVTALAERLAPGGTLVLSAAEPILKPHPLLVTVRCGEAFFYRRRGPGERMPSLELPRIPTGEIPAVILPSVSPSRPPLPPAANPIPPPRPKPPDLEDPAAEARRIFQLVLDWAAAGESDADTEQGLRRALYLDPHFAQARYLLGMMLEQRGDKADAANEYRRALAALKEGRAQATPFFLNNERLRFACEAALRRVGYRL